MLQILFFLIPVVVAYIVWIVITEFSPFNKWQLREWFFLYIAGTIADVISTFNAIYNYHYPWENETNWFIITLGPHTGFYVAVFAHTVLMILIIYMVAKVLIRFRRTNLAFFILFIFSCGRFIAALHNFLLPLIGISFF